ncbi:MAG: RlmE family RNA methyltransferase [Candidatus Nanoarchaeia archaeon]
MSEVWFKKRKQEFFYRKAKKEKFRARSAYKLLEIQNKFKIIKKDNIVIDLGAAPGSWSQVALDCVGKNGLVIGVDIVPISDLGKNFEAVLGDICAQSTIKKVNELLDGKKADVVLCDAAPKFSGIKSKDIGLALKITKCALNFALSVLKQNGCFVTKAFRGPEYGFFLREIRQYFKQVKEFKPKASLKGSAEIYIICTGFRLKQKSEKSRK